MAEQIVKYKNNGECVSYLGLTEDEVEVVFRALQYRERVLLRRSNKWKDVHDSGDATSRQETFRMYCENDLAVTQRILEQINDLPFDKLYDLMGKRDYNLSREFGNDY